MPQFQILIIHILKMNQILHQLRLRHFQQEEDGIQRQDYPKPQFLGQSAPYPQLEFQFLGKLQLRHRENSIYELHHLARLALLHHERKFRAGGSLQELQFPHRREELAAPRPQIRQAKLEPEWCEVVLMLLCCFPAPDFGNFGKLTNFAQTKI